MLIKKILFLPMSFFLSIILQGCVSDISNYTSVDPILIQQAKQGDPKAECKIGLIYQNGIEVPQNYYEAARWYDKSAKKGYAPAQNNLGYLYQIGKGVDFNYNIAMNLYNESAAQGYALAQNNLAFMYQRQNDYRKTLYWFLKSAKQGNETALIGLGDLFINPRAYSYLPVTSKNNDNYAMAYAFWLTANALGDKKITAQMNLIERYLTKRQIEDAKIMSKRLISEIKKGNKNILKSLYAK